MSNDKGVAMKRPPPPLRLAVIFIALALGMILALAIWRGYFRGAGPRDPQSFQIRLEEAHRIPPPSDIALRIQIRPSGAFDVTEARGCGLEFDLTRDNWTAPCATRTVTNGAMDAEDLMALRDSIRSAGFYKWRDSYGNAFGNNEAARLCVEEAGGTRCVLVRHSLYFSRSGPDAFWILRRDLYQRVGLSPTGGK
jgi:hypothetical protein